MDTAEANPEGKVRRVSSEVSLAVLSKGKEKVRKVVKARKITKGLKKTSNRKIVPRMLDRILAINGEVLKLLMHAY